MSNKKLNCFFCKALATSSIKLGENFTKVCDSCKTKNENKTWVKLGEYKEKGVNPNHISLYKADKMDDPNRKDSYIFKKHK